MQECNGYIFIYVLFVNALVNYFVRIALATKNKFIKSLCYAYIF